MRDPARGGARGGCRVCNQQFLHPSAERVARGTLAPFLLFLGFGHRNAAVTGTLEGKLLSTPHRDDSVSGTAEWASIRETTARFRSPSLVTSVGQLASSFLPVGSLYALMYASLSLGWWATLALSLVTAGFVVRIFIIQHDCGHGSFLRSRSANDAVGIACSLVTSTPYAMWRCQHAGHPANWNNRDRRKTRCWSATWAAARAPATRPGASACRYVLG